LDEKSRNDRKKFLRLMRKIYGVSEDGEWKILLQNIDASEKQIAFVYWDKNLVVIDPRFDIILSLMHECIHILDDEGKIILIGKTLGEREAEVEELEKFCKVNIRADQAHKLIRLLTQNLCHPKTNSGL
jgi:hypothetical protein